VLLRLPKCQLSSVFLGVKFHPISTWKIWFQPIQRIFHENVDPNSANFEVMFFQIANFYDKFNRQPKIFLKYIFFLLSYLVCSQIYLNHLMDDCHFNYITKLENLEINGNSKKHIWNPLKCVDVKVFHYVLLMMFHYYFWNLKMEYTINNIPLNSL